MKILHSSDWHLGKRLGRFSRLEEQKEVLNEIVGIAREHNPDLVLLPGDMFDTFNPPAEAVELLYRTLHRLSGGGKCPVIVLAGNHDSPDRIESADPLARMSGIFFIGYPWSQPTGTDLEGGWEIRAPEAGVLLLRKQEMPRVCILTTPYAGEVRLRRAIDPQKGEQEISRLLKEHWKGLAEKYCEREGVNILMAHLFASNQSEMLFPELQEEDGERPILHPGGLELIPFSAFPGDIDYVALGHLHRPSISQSNAQTVCYSGTPLAYSLSEAEQQKQIFLAELEPGKAAVVKTVPLVAGRKIRRGKFKTLEDALTWLEEYREDYVEITMEVERYLDSGVRDSLLESHSRVLAVVPEIQGADEFSRGADTHLDIDAPVDQLFVDYFRWKNGGADPDPSLLELLREAMAETGEDL